MSSHRCSHDTAIFWQHLCLELAFLAFADSRRSSDMGKVGRLRNGSLDELFGRQKGRNMIDTLVTNVSEAFTLRTTVQETTTSRPAFVNSTQLRPVTWQVDPPRIFMDQPGRLECFQRVRPMLVTHNYVIVARKQPYGSDSNSPSPPRTFWETIFANSQQVQ